MRALRKARRLPLTPGPEAVKKEENGVEQPKSAIPEALQYPECLRCLLQKDYEETLNETVESLQKKICFQPQYGFVLEERMATVEQKQQYSRFVSTWQRFTQREAFDEAFRILEGLEQQPVKRHGVKSKQRQAMVKGYRNVRTLLNL